jgi:hypothetical protein
LSISQAHRGRPRSINIGEQTPNPAATPASSSAAALLTAAPVAKITTKQIEEPEAKRHRAPLRIPVGQISQAVAKLAKEEGFDKEAAIEVLSISKEIEGASPETRKAVPDELRAIYQRS